LTPSDLAEQGGNTHDRGVWVLGLGYASGFVVVAGIAFDVKDLSCHKAGDTAFHWLSSLDQAITIETGGMREG
jgi:hypothetical protein